MAFIEITAISLRGGNSHEHVTAARWRSACTPAGESTREAIVAWLAARHDNHAVVASEGEVPVAVAVRPGDPPYLRACADGSWTDHLLALPRF